MFAHVYVYVNAPSMPMICMYTCNYCRQLAQMGYFRSSEICSAIPRQWYNILNQKKLCHRSTTLYRFLHISTMSTNVYYIPKNTLLLFGAWLAMQQLLNTHQLTSYQLHTIYTLTVKAITLQNWVLAFNGFQWYQKRRGYKPGLGVPLQQVLCYKSAPTA